MRIARTLSWLSVFAGIATYLATRAAMQKRDEHERKEVEERTRWETDGGATTAGPQTPGATL